MPVQRVFEEAVAGAATPPGHPWLRRSDGAYTWAHLAILLWWLLDNSEQQRATRTWVALTAQVLPSAAMPLRLPPVRRFVIAADDLVREATFGNGQPA